VQDVPDALAEGPQRPDTPVVVCWIEGGWGSYWSYVGGPPTKHKRLDFWRAINVAAGEPQVLRPDVLASHRQTRAYLNELCRQARRYLGLDPVAPAGEAGRPAPEEEAGRP
jgi:hypothetical protein